MDLAQINPGDKIKFLFDSFDDNSGEPCRKLTTGVFKQVQDGQSRFTKINVDEGIILEDGSFFNVKAMNLESLKKR